MSRARIAPLWAWKERWNSAPLPVLRIALLAISAASTTNTGAMAPMAAGVRRRRSRSISSCLEAMSARSAAHARGAKRPRMLRAMPPCPAPLYGWAQVEPPGGGSPILLQRCEECGLAIVAGTSAGEAIGELFGAAHGAREVRAPNRRSLQAALGGRRWAALDPERRRVYPTPEALQLLAARAGLEIEALRFPASRQALRWMWQTVVNSFTFRPNL